MPVLVAVNISVGSEDSPSALLEGESSLLRPPTPPYHNNIAQDTSIHAFYSIVEAFY